MTPEQRQARNNEVYIDFLHEQIDEIQNIVSSGLRGDKHNLFYVHIDQIIDHINEERNRDK